MIKLLKQLLMEKLQYTISNDGENDATNPSIELPSTPHSIDWGDNKKIPILLLI